jgi:nucleotide-binding universal stress UspA family protein
MYRTILAALDGSPRELGVLRAAAALARMSGGALHVCRAVAMPVGIPEMVWAMPGPRLDDALVDDARQALARRIADSPAPVVGTHVRLGQAADVVLGIATEVGADLIVIGAHGYGAIERLLGTTASKIVHRAPCSVFVARGDVAQ